MDKIRYVNHLGREISLFGADENRNLIVGSYKGARAYQYSHENGSLYIEPKAWEALLVCSPRKKANELIEILETDSIADESGCFYFNDWYIRCKYLGVSEIVFENERFIKLSLSFLSMTDEWSKENEFVLIPEATQTAEGLDYPYNFEFDYAGVSTSLQTIANESLLDADFRLRFDGSDSLQSLLIGGHSYAVDNTIARGESFFLDTEKQIVYKTTPNGKVDLFPVTSDTDFIFEKLPYGVHKVIWNTKNTLYITILEHRRIPPWI